MDGRQGDGMMLDSNDAGGQEALHQKVQYVCGCKYTSFINAHIFLLRYHSLRKEERVGPRSSRNQMQKLLW